MSSPNHLFWLKVTPPNYYLRNTQIALLHFFPNLNNKTDENAHWCRKICKYNYFLPIQSHYFNVLSAAKRIQSLLGKWPSHCQHPLKGCATYTHCSPKVTQGKSKGPMENKRDSSSCFWTFAKEKAMDWASHSLGLKDNGTWTIYFSNKYNPPSILSYFKVFQAILKKISGFSKDQRKVPDFNSSEIQTSPCFYSELNTVWPGTS